MADPTGTAGLRPETQSDLALATRGGAGFMQRLQQLGDAADRLEQAAAKVRLTDTIQSSLQQAEAKLADAEQQNQNARRMVQEATMRAKGIVDSASKQASETSKTALGVKVRAEADADVVRKNADDYAKKMRDEADAARADIKTRVDAARAAQGKAIEELANAKAATDKATQAASLAETRAKELQAKIERLQAAIRATS
jgi:chromosome segregation ATPase